MEKIFTAEDIAFAEGRAAMDFAAEQATQDATSEAPWHTVYGGAHRFQKGLTAKLDRLALQSWDALFPSASELATATKLSADEAKEAYRRTRARLERGALEDFRIDFEDGYGRHSDEEEDQHAQAAGLATAEDLAAGLLPRSFGIRVRGILPHAGARSAHTLERYLGTLLDKSAGRLPKGFVVALPKVSYASQVSGFVHLLRRFEERALLPHGVLKLELLVESPRALFDRQGVVALPRLVAAAEGRVVALHLGAYDLTAACNVPSVAQRLDHPLCDVARWLLQLTAAGTGIRVVDGVTAVLPLGDATVARPAWIEHFENVRRALAMGIESGWDLHPAQFGARAAANLSYFRSSLVSSAQRLGKLVTDNAVATTTGVAFDDAATGEGLVRFFRRALAVGATDAAELAKLGLPAKITTARDFVSLVTAL